MNTNTKFRTSLFSRPFVFLSYFGAWNMTSESDLKNKLYKAYQICMCNFAIVGLISMVADFVEVLGQFNAMTYNVCFTSVFTASFIKLCRFAYLSKAMDILRRELHNETECRQTAEERKIDEFALKQMKTLYIAFYMVLVACVPLGLYLLYFRSPKGPNTFGLPMKFPFEIRYENAVMFNGFYFFGSLLGFVAFIIVIENELTIFTLLIQISREYKILIQNISKLDKLYKDQSQNSLKKGLYKIGLEVNPILRKLKEKKLVKELSAKQQRINW